MPSIPATADEVLFFEQDHSAPVELRLHFFSGGVGGVFNWWRPWRSHWRSRRSEVSRLLIQVGALAELRRKELEVVVIFRAASHLCMAVDVVEGNANGK